MLKHMYVAEEELTALAKRFRIESGRRRVDAARDLKVSPPTIQLTEDEPTQSLTKLRIKMIEKCSSYRVTGPFFLLEKK